MKKVNIPKNELEELVNKKPIIDIAKKYGCTEATIKRRINEYGIFRTRHSHLINHYYFQKWNNEMAYILGFIFADGCVSIDKKHGHHNLIIELNKQDDHMLIYIKNRIQPTLKIRYYQRKNKKTNTTSDMCQINFSSKKIVENLIKLGCIPNKTKSNLSIPDIPEPYTKDFIRGYFDGDGTVGKYETGTQCRITSASETLLIDIQNILGYGKISEDSNAYRLYFSIEEISKLYNYMYTNARHYYLRKYQKFNEILR